MNNLINYNLDVKDMIDLELQSLILCIEDYYSTQKRNFSTLDLPELLIRLKKEESKTQDDYVSLTYELHIKEEIRQVYMFDYLTYYDYPPYSIPLKKMKSYFCDFLLNLNEINTLSDRFNIYKKMYNQFSLNKINQNFHKVIDKLQADDSGDYYNIENINSSYIMYEFERPSFFKNFDSACKFSKYGGFSSDFLDTQAKNFIILKSNLIEAVHNFHQEHPEKETLNFSDIMNMDISDMPSPALIEKLKEVHTLRDALNEFEFIFSLKHNYFTKEKVYPEIMSMDSYKQYLKEYYMDVEIDSDINHTIKTCLINIEKSMLAQYSGDIQKKTIITRI